MTPIVADISFGKTLINQGDPQPLVIPHSVSSGPARMLLVPVTFNFANTIGNTGPVVISADWDGTPLTFLEAYEPVEAPIANFNRIEWWYLLNPVVGNFDVNVTVTDPVFPFTHAIIAGAITLHFVSQATPFSPRVTANSGGFGSGGPIVLTIPATATQLMVATTSSRAGHDQTAQPPITQLYFTTQAGDGGGGDERGGTGTIPGSPPDVTFTWTDAVLAGGEEWAVMGAPINFENTSPLRTPANVMAIRRANYAFVRWDPVIMNLAGDPVTIASYQVFRSSLLNEADQELLATVVTLNAAGTVDSAFVDTSPGETSAYRIVAVAGVVQSDLSERSVAIHAPSSVDAKIEHIDRVLMFWDEGEWGEDLWT